MQEMQGTWALSLGQEDPLEESMATHSSILACRIPRTCQRNLACYNPLGPKELDTTEHTRIHCLNLRCSRYTLAKKKKKKCIKHNPLKEKMATNSSILAWEIPWTEKPARL